MSTTSRLFVYLMGAAGFATRLCQTGVVVEDAKSVPAASSPPRHHPIWVPSFPGSGSEMTIQIVNAITVDEDMKGQDVYSGQCNQPEHRLATCKTHYPFFQRRFPTQVDPNATFHNTALLLVRNPLQALPSLGNYMYEYRYRESNNNITGHSTKAPQEWWREWRDGNFEKRWKQWMALIRYWKSEKAPVTSVAVLPYERLTQPGTGPQLVEILARQLEAAHIATHSDLQERWNQVVQVQATKKRKTAAYTPRFTTLQILTMAKDLGCLANDFLDDSSLTTVLRGYQQDILEAATFDEPFVPPSSEAAVHAL